MALAAAPQLEWTRETVIDACIGYHTAHGSWPRREAFGEDSALPSKAVVARLFGAANDAVFAAVATWEDRKHAVALLGAPTTDAKANQAIVEALAPLQAETAVTSTEEPTPPEPVKQGRPVKWTVDGVLQAFAMFYRTERRWPVIVDFSHYKALPARNTVLSLLGTLRNAVAMTRQRYPDLVSSAPTAAIPLHVDEKPAPALEPVCVEPVVEPPPVIEAVAEASEPTGPVIPLEIAHCNGWHKVTTDDATCSECGTLLLGSVPVPVAQAANAVVTFVGHVAEEIAGLERQITDVQQRIAEWRHAIAKAEAYQQQCEALLEPLRVYLGRVSPPPELSQAQGGEE